MKKLILLFLFPLAVFGRVDTYQLTGGYGTNAIGPVDVSESTSALVQVSFAGLPERSNQGVVALTNVPAANATLAIVLAGTSTTYTFVASPSLTNYTYSGSSPLARIGVTNTPTTGDTFTIVRSDGTTSITNAIVWTNAAPAGQNFVFITNSIGGNATNLYSRLSSFGWTLTASSYPLVGYYATNGIELRGQPNETWAVTNSAGWGTNLNTTYYAYTNGTATNSLQIATNTTTGNTATNLYNKLVTDYAGLLNVGWLATNMLSITTISNGSLSFTQSAGWGTNNVVTNWINGSIILAASNSLDNATWYQDTNRNITISFNGLNSTNYATNFTSLVYPFEQWTWQNAYTNAAKASGFNFKVSTKKGL